MNLQSCGWCCGGFSTFAIIFLCVVAAVINSESEVIKLDTGKTGRAQAVRNLLIAAGIYCGFLLLSVVCVVFRPSAKQDQDVPAMDANVSVSRRDNKA